MAKTPPTVEEKARELHAPHADRDTHSDTAFSLLRTDWKIGDRHDPSARGAGKIDLPRMKEGGLDAGFFAAFVGQGPLTPEAYVKAKDRALQAVAAVRKMTEEYPPMIGLAVDPAGARRLKKEGNSRPSSAWRTAIPSAGTCPLSHSSTRRASATSPSAIRRITTSATPRPTAAIRRTRA